jgi:hypothetical protein
MLHLADGSFLYGDEVAVEILQPFRASMARLRFDCERIPHQNGNLLNGGPSSRTATDAGHP